MADAAAEQKSLSFQVSVNHIFPTPIVRAELADHEALNAALLKSIAERRATQESTSHSNLGGWQSSWDMDRWGGPAFVALVRAAMQIVTRMTATRTGQPAAPQWRFNAWANVNGRGHGNEFHQHPGAFWSAVYYVDDGGIGVATVMYAPTLTIAGRASQAMGGAEQIAPKVGTLIAFPSWLSHGVRPYAGSRERVSIAINFFL
jgi:uncharacterized protein (TIGR02466 family)